MIDGPDLKPMPARPSGLQRFVAALAVAALLIPSAGTAGRAADRIGSTEIAKNVVEELTGVATKPIAPNDAVFANESVRTGADSAAKFVFSDSTNLAIGPTSTVKLDKFVYNSDTDYKKAALKLTAGAFRFTTGGSEKKAYEIRTNTATIGVRGTILDVLALQLRIEDHAHRRRLRHLRAQEIQRRPANAEQEAAQEIRLPRADAAEPDRQGHVARRRVVVDAGQFRRILLRRPLRRFGGDRGEQPAAHVLHEAELSGRKPYSACSS